MSMFSRLAEQKIEEAIRKGELDTTAYAGKPLPVDDLSHIPEDLRMSYRLLKNSGYVPEEVSLQKECVRLYDLIHACSNEAEREQHQKMLNEKSLRLHMLLEQRGLGSSGAFLQYETQIKDKLT
ncbi:DnaJ family domain-containing protein [Paenibacillus dakarensis]|uniref:DnaJ family domain-containing protein n=1 Tax=Paenibacillus dakarensis TaxID=1527293 RepID=UPI0006D5313E|nr:DnaJ family domain-containing protein [Paenibacillus dakarensis]